MTHSNPAENELRRLLENAGTIALVGASSKDTRPSNAIMQVLLDAGFNVIPVTPRETEVLGQKAYPSLADVPHEIDIVDVFRRAEETPQIARDAAARGVGTLWLQKGVENEETAQIAKDGGINVVMNRCIGETTLQFGIRKGPVRDRVDEAGWESFPASDPPTWGKVRPGGPVDDKADL
ncbi:MAG TPA: CoA-binding protein [Gemmatimonadales bacterium]|nr:CoA-binding protein [Gemmatimonadales bacterium]